MQVQVRDSSNVQFRAGGLLTVTAVEDGSSAWVALTLTQATSVLGRSPTLTLLTLTLTLTSENRVLIYGWLEK